VCVRECVPIIVVRIERWSVGSNDPMSHSTSIVFDSTQVRFCSVFLCLLCFSYGSSVFSVFLFVSSVFPLLSPFFCLVPLFSLYFLSFFLSTLSTTYRSYLRIVLRPSCLQSFSSLLTLLKYSNLTTLVPSIILHDMFIYIIP